MQRTTEAAMSALLGPILTLEALQNVIKPTRYLKVATILLCYNAVNDHLRNRIGS